MENSERPEKRRKLDEDHDVPGSKNSQPRQMTLGERKRNGPRVLVNKLNINHDVIERLRRITKVCGKQAAVGKTKNQNAEVLEVNVSKVTENKREVVNGSCNGSEPRKVLPKENNNKESTGKVSIQGLTPSKNGTKDVKITSVENGKSQEDDDEVKKQTATDVEIFKQVLTEIIQQRTKLVEEAVAANSIHLQNRIRDLERQNRELQCNARKVLAAFKKIVLENEKKQLPKTSRGIQVDIDPGLGSEVPASPVIPVAQSTFFAKPSVKVITAAESVRTPSLTSSSSSNATNIPATSRSDSGLNHIAQKSVLQQSPLHEKPNAVSHPQQTSTAAPTTTAVTFTVNPRPAQLTMHQGGSKAPEKETRNLQTISAQPVLPKAHQQPQTVEQIKSSPGITSQIQLSSQANSALDRIRQHQEKLLQQRQVLQQQHKQQQQQQHEQQQQRFPRASTPTVQQQKHPAETTASLLQQLQRQQQFQQQQHYQRMAVQQQKPQERHLSAPSSQIRQQQVSALAPRQPDPSIPQNQQIHQQSVRPSSGQLSNSQERNCSSIPSQNPVYTLEQLRQSRSQQNAASNPLPSLLSSSARNPNNVLKPDEASVVNSAGKNSTSPKLITLSNLSNQRAHLVNSNTLVHEHINKLANNSRSSQMSSSVQVRNSGQHGETLHRQETASAVNVAANGTYSRESTEYQHAQHRQQPGATQNHKTTATGREGSHIPRDVLAAAASTYKQIQPDAHPGILVPARKKHIEEEVLPSGYRFSVPSPEYLIQRQRIQQQQQQQQRDQPQHPQASHVSQNQSLQRKTHPERVSLSGGQRRDPSGLVYMREHPTREMPIIQLQTAQKETVLNQTSQNEAVPPPGYRPIRSSLENWSQQQNHHEHRRQQHQSQPTHASQDLQSLQGQQEVTNEGGNHPITQLSIYRPPIQSPGISSSDPPNEKHPRDAQKTTHPATANQPSNTNLIVLNQGNTLPKPSASIAVMDSGIVLSWNMEYDDASIKIDNYELFACQDVTETNGQPIKWKKIGIVKALPLPMACTLTQFSSGSKYFFSVRAVDGKERAGPFSDPCTVSLNSS